MQSGIVGLPNVGKSTLFMALTGTKVKAEIYPFSTTDANLGVVEVRDERLDYLFEVYRPKPERKGSPVMEFVDVAGLVRGASRGEGLGNQFLARIREVDSLIHLVRCFRDQDIAHVDGALDPIRDLETVETELILADLQVVDRSIERVERKAKGGDKESREELDSLRKIEEQLNQMVPVRQMPLSPVEQERVKGFSLLTAKPVLYVANIDEDSLPQGGNEFSQRLEKFLNERGDQVLPVCAKVEAELADLDPEEVEEFAQVLGIGESGLKRLIQGSYRMLDLITFFTANQNEARGTTVVRGTTAGEAAGKIHSDMERGFIRAEVVSFDDFRQAGGWVQAKDMGLLRSEGRDYQVQDGDIILFRFHV